MANEQMKASDKAIEIIKRFEGLYLRSYTCEAGIWTIGYGHTKGVMFGDVINEMQAEIYLREDLQAVETSINYLGLNLTQNQFDALCSFVFNVGIGNFMRSTMLKKIKAGDMAGAADEFPIWTKAGGKVLAGLIDRRKAEKDLFSLNIN